MYFLGIDIGKHNHVASLMDEQGKVIFKAFSFPNTTKGGDALLGKLGQYTNDTAMVDVGLEATGHYWLALYAFLHERSYTLHVINPIQIDGWRKGVEIRKRKTDTIDSLLIADLIRYGDFLETKLPDETLLSLRALSRFRSFLVDSIADLKRKVICVLDQVFPEYQSVFSDVFGTTSKELLLAYPTPALLERVSVDALEALLSDLSRKRCQAHQAKKLHDLASNSFGLSFCSDSFSFQLRALLEQMKFIERQVKDTECEIAAIMDTLQSPITTITGIGPVLGAVILGEIGDITRFSSPGKLVAYTGIDASVSQSGESSSTNNRISKRGSPYLRRALYQASVVAAFHDPDLMAF